MKKIKITLIAAWLVTLIISSCKKDTSTTSTTPTPTVDPNQCVSGSAVNNGSIIAGQYIISYNTGALNRRASAADITSVSADVLERNDILQSKLIGGFAGEPGGFIAKLTDDEVAKLGADPSIKVIEPDRVVSLGGCFTIAAPSLITWNVRRVGYGDGRGKTAWILDSGIDMDHPDLNVDATKSRSFVSGITSPDDDNGHGTHVAGIIGALNNTYGVLGIASGATLISLKVMGADGQGTLSSIIQALAYVNSNASAGDVVNMSFGLDGVSPTLNDQIISTANRGIYFAIAAGNDAQLASKISPANTNGTNIYTVSAIDSLDRFARFSNYGNDVVDYAEPGVGILSTFSQGRYAYLSGTSMAAPHLAGLLLLKGRNLTVSGTAKNDPDGVADPIGHY